MIPFPKTTVWIGSAALLFFVMAASTNATASAMATSSASQQPTPNTDQQHSPSLTQSETQSAKLWNRFAQSYAKSPIADQVSYETKLAMTRKYLTTSTTRVLEFGCGTGGTALLHAPYVKQYDAIDISSRMIDTARAKQTSSTTDTSHVHFRVQGLHSLPVPTKDSSLLYNVVLGLSILHLMPHRVQAIRKVHQLLKPGGMFISSTPCIGDMPGVSLLVKFLGPPLAWLGVIPHVHVFTKATLRRDLEQNGFAIQEEFHPGQGKGVFLIAKKI
mmetsp:Transcript_15328/g.31157  ORF Transcript_15328/g.31157 Transcript_15328/m.31157 type:complete len:273 (+) Transcript_15328:48-866(+)